MSSILDYATSSDATNPRAKWKSLLKYAAIVVGLNIALFGVALAVRPWNMLYYAIIVSPLVNLSLAVVGTVVAVIRGGKMDEQVAITLSTATICALFQFVFSLPFFDIPRC